MAKITDRLRSAWNAFTSRDPTPDWEDINYGYQITSSRPDRFIMSPTNGRTIVASIYNRIAVDVAGMSFIHAKLDENKRYSKDMNSNLNTCLTLSANLDQTSKQFIQDLVLSLFDEGCIAVVPTDGDMYPNGELSDISELRIGKIVQWYPSYVKVEVYNEQTGQKEQKNFPKSSTAIIENPFYAVMNSHNSTKERLTHKMLLLDKMDNTMASNKLDLILQVPYLMKSPAQKRRGKERIKDLTQQLTDSPLGIAVSDGTEKIVQLNRSITNNLPEEVKNLQTDLFNQFNMTQDILNGTATSDQVVQYYDRTIEPICDAICDEFTRKFLSKTAITQGQRIIYYRDPFKLTTLSEMAEAVQYLIPNQITTANEIRAGLGLKPCDQPQADQLINPNINTVNGDAGMAGDNNTTQPEESPEADSGEEDDYMNMPLSTFTG